MNKADYLIAGRIARIRDICRSAIAYDNKGNNASGTDRQWLAQSVLNILDGNLDAQIEQSADEAHVVERP